MLIEVNRTEEEGKKEYKVTPKVSVQENKAVTVDVSEYTEPVEILPPEGKVAMEKVTLTLDNIPSGGSAIAYAWSDNSSPISTYYYFPFDEAPVNATTLLGTKYLIPTSNDSTKYIIEDEVNSEWDLSDYEHVSDSEFVADGLTFTRDSTKDLTLW